uniref:lysozyme n=1 Tax=Meloidogyne incognita TaxID=6306 RepID=A0A914MS87_MELIC
MKALIKVIIFSLFFVSIKTADEQTCLDCICKHESFGCTPRPCAWDDDAVSCGYFQIKHVYYLDCGTPGLRSGESTEDGWKRCALDYSCSVQCIRAFINRYASQCNKPISACERMSRLHNGGPNGCSLARTDVYWNAVKRCAGGK